MNSDLNVASGNETDVFGNLMYQQINEIGPNGISEIAQSDNLNGPNNF